MGWICSAKSSPICTFFLFERLIEIYANFDHKTIRGKRPDLMVSLPQDNYIVKMHRKIQGKPSNRQCMGQSPQNLKIKEPDVQIINKRLRRCN